MQIKFVVGLHERH